MYQVFRLFAVLLVIVSTRAAAQESGTGDPHATFDTAVNEYKDSLRQIKDLEIKFQSASAAEREELNVQLKEIVAVGQVKLDRMVDAAIAAHQADPKKNPQVAELLKEVAIHLAVGSEPPKATGGNHSGGDQPEKALEIVDALVDSGVSEAMLPVIGAVSAVHTNDFNAAKKYFELAEKGEALQGLPPYATPETDALTAYRMSAVGYRQELPQLEQAWEKEVKIRAAEAQADDLPRVKVTTSKGDFVIELFENEAPQATANFLALVKQGYYDGLPFHRVLTGFMAQGGDNGRGPGYTIRCECYQPNYRQHFRGSISMAKPAQPERDSGGAQFFLCFVPTRHLDGRHTAFGRVVEGIGVLGNLQKIDPSKPGPYPVPDKIIKASVIRDRGHDYEFEKIPSAG